jgi:hypothetical protein
VASLPNQSFFKRPTNYRHEQRRNHQVDERYDGCYNKDPPLHPPTQANECLGDGKQNFANSTSHCYRNGFVPPT